MERFRVALENGAEVALTEKDAKEVFREYMARHVAAGLRNMSEHNSYLCRPLSEDLVSVLAEDAVGEIDIADSCGESYWDAIAYDMIVRAIVRRKDQLCGSTPEEILEELGCEEGGTGFAAALKEFDDRIDGEFRKWNEDDMLVRLGEGQKLWDLGYES